MADKPGAEDGQSLEQGPDDQQPQDSSQDQESPDKKSDESLLSQIHRKNQEAKSLRDRLKKLEAERKEQEEKRLAEEQKWQELAEKRAEELEKERQRAQQFIESLRHTKRDAALDAALANAGVKGQRSALLRRAILADPDFKVEFDDETHAPKADFDSAVKSAVESLGLSSDETQETKQKSSGSPPPWSEGGGRKQTERPKSDFEFAREVTARVLGRD